MSYKITAISTFLREAKRLGKKYPSLKKEIEILSNQLKENPLTGTPLGKNCFKIKLGIASKGKGKSGGARIITCVIFISRSVYLLSIYDKSERADVSDKELQILLNSFNH